MRTLLWLDDIRDPKVWASKWAPEYTELQDRIIWVKNYEEFTKWITTYGLPTKIAFDHDLGVTKPDNISVSDLLKEPIVKRETGHYRESMIEDPTGMDAAKWLVDYCLDRNCRLPEYVIQSSNPSGTDNINGLLTGYIKHYYENN